jgi:hypothetical protein
MFEKKFFKLFFFFQTLHKSLFFFIGIETKRSENCGENPLGCLFQTVYNPALCFKFVQISLEISSGILSQMNER